MLCWFGIHRWRSVRKRLSHWDPQHTAYEVTDQCTRCKKVRRWYDTGGN